MSSNEKNAFNKLFEIRQLFRKKVNSLENNFREAQDCGCTDDEDFFLGKIEDFYRDLNKFLKRKND